MSLNQSLFLNKFILHWLNCISYQSPKFPKVYQLSPPKLRNYIQDFHRNRIFMTFNPAKGNKLMNWGISHWKDFKYFVRIGYLQQHSLLKENDLTND